MKKVEVLKLELNDNYYNKNDDYFFCFVFTANQTSGQEINNFVLFLIRSCFVFQTYHKSIPKNKTKAT